MWKDLDKLQERSWKIQAEGEEQRQGRMGRDEEAGTDSRERGLLVGYAGRNVSLKTFSQPGLGHHAGGGIHEEPMRTGERGAGEDSTIYLYFRKRALIAVERMD